jgi:hypothetical protein
MPGNFSAEMEIHKMETRFEMLSDLKRPGMVHGLSVCRNCVTRCYVMFGFGGMSSDGEAMCTYVCICIFTCICIEFIYA